MAKVKHCLRPAGDSASDHSGLDQAFFEFSLGRTAAKFAALVDMRWNGAAIGPE